MDVMICAGSLIKGMSCYLLNLEASEDLKIDTKNAN